MWWLIGGIAVLTVLILWSSLKVASDSDDELGYD